VLSTFGIGLPAPALKTVDLFATASTLGTLSTQTKRGRARPRLMAGRQINLGRITVRFGRTHIHAARDCGSR